MKLTIHHKIKNTINIDKKIYDVSASFDVILRLLDLLEDKRLYPVDRVNLALRMLLNDELSDYTIDEKSEILKHLLDEFLGFDKKERLDILGNPMPEKETQKLIDYNIDSTLIYSAFMQAYGIDLIEEQGRLHWLKFRALMDNLPEDTQLMKVIGYRSYDPSDEKKDYKQTMLELKNHYSLEEGGATHE